jgi:hypothetical protein
MSSPGLKNPLLGLCILSTETESMGLPGLRAATHLIVADYENQNIKQDAF